jgi:hypothetical protein
MSERHDEESRLHINTTWPPRGRARRTILGVAAVTAAAGTIMVLSAAAGTSVAGADPNKVTLCHATDSNTNPYVQVTVSSRSVQHKILGPNGHGTHTGQVWNPTLKSQGIQWGDIIPPFDYGNPVQHYPGLNWDATGIAIWENGCNIPAGTTSSTPPSSTPPSSTPPSSTPPSSTPPTTPTTPGTSGTSSHRTPPPTHTPTHTKSGTSSHRHTPAVHTTANGPIPQGVSAGLHTPIANAGLKAWGVVLMVLGGAAGLLAGLWPTRRRAH